MYLSDRCFTHTRTNTSNLLSVQNLSHFIHINVASWEEFHTMLFKQAKYTPWALPSLKLGRLSRPLQALTLTNTGSFAITIFKMVIQNHYACKFSIQMLYKSWWEQQTTFCKFKRWPGTTCDVLKKTPPTNFL